MDAYNLIDLFIVVTLGIGFIIGLWKGFIRSLTATAGLLVGVVLATRYYQVVEPYLGKVSSLDPHVAMALSMILVFVGVQVVFVAVRRLLEALLDLTRLTWFDRLVGAALGLVAGTVTVVGGVQMILHLMPEWPELRTSRLMVPITELTNDALKRAPKPVHDWMETMTQSWKATKLDPRQQPGVDGNTGRKPTAIPIVPLPQQGRVKPN
jgi:membrane protein required for colicin V production